MASSTTVAKRIPLMNGPRPALKELVLKVGRSWATRSLAIGAVATLMDIAVGVLCVNGLLLPTRAGAMVGVAIGGAFTFFANRHLAFKEHNPKLASPALKFLGITVVSMLVHGQLVVLMRDHLGIPFVPAKMIADVGVFSIGQLVLLRFVVFPRKATAQVEPLLLNGAKAEFGALELKSRELASSAES